MISPSRTLRLPVLAAAFLFLGAPAGAATPEQTTFAPNLEIVDIPTASTLYARMFHLNFRAFPMMREVWSESDLLEGGGSGILLKGLASFNNSLSLGLALKANNIIGNGNIVFEEGDEAIVAAVAKIKLFHLPGSDIRAAIGYDGMGYEVTRKKGLYLVGSKDLAAGVFFFRAHLGAGAVQFRGFQADDHLNLFCGLSAALSEELFLGIEYDDMLRNDHDDYLSKDDPEYSSTYGSANAMIAYAWDVGLRLELGFKRLFRGMNDHYRVLKILYTF